jgi:hypothetical protein
LPSYSDSANLGVCCMHHIDHPSNKYVAGVALK